MVESTDLTYEQIFSILTRIEKSEHIDKVIQSYRTIIKNDQIYSLDLIGLRIEKLHNDIFDELTSLTHLYLSWNHIKELPVNIFYKLNQLNHIDLRGSGVNVVQNGLFKNLRSLQRLELNDNNLEKLPEQIFEDLTSLRELNLSNNKIQSLHPKIFDNLSNLNRLYLYFNPLPGEISLGNYYDRETVLEVIDLLSSTSTKEGSK